MKTKEGLDKGGSEEEKGTKHIGGATCTKPEFGRKYAVGRDWAIGVPAFWMTGYMSGKLERHRSQRDTGAMRSALLYGEGRDLQKFGQGHQYHVDLLQRGETCQGELWGIRSGRCSLGEAVGTLKESHQRVLLGK